MTPILKYLDYSEKYYKKTDEYFSIIIFAGPRQFFVNFFCRMKVDYFYKFPFLPSRQ